MVSSKPKNYDQAANIILLALFSVFILAGLGLTIWYTQLFARAFESTSWGSVRGTIVHAQVESEYKGEGDTCHSDHVVYQYTVDGREYNNDVIRIGRSTCKRKSVAEEIVKRYPPNSQVLVFLDPEDPELSCLETGHYWYNLWGIAGGLLLLVAGITFILMHFRKAKDDQKVSARNPNLVFYDSESGRGLFPTFYMFFLAFLTAGTIAWATDVIYVAPVAIFFFAWTVLRVLYWIRNVKWEAGIEDGKLWWASPGFPKSKGEVSLHDVGIIKLAAGETEAVVVLHSTLELLDIPFSGNAQKLKRVLEKKYRRIDIIWKD